MAAINTLLIVEDDMTLCDGIAIALKNYAYKTEQAHTLEEAKRLIMEGKISLVILDVNLPDGNGLSFLQEIKKSMQLPVIILTANDMETDIVTGLELGADDYITKPFSLAILRARVNTQLRKNTEQNLKIVKIADYIFDFEHMEFSYKDRMIELSKTEQKLLRILVENKGQTVTRESLVDHIWTDGAQYVDENALSVTVKRLRNKLEDDSSQYIKTVYGIGYSWIDKQD